MYFIVTLVKLLNLYYEIKHYTDCHYGLSFRTFFLQMTDVR